MKDPMIWRVLRLADYDPIRYREIYNESTHTEIAMASAARMTDNWVPPIKKK